MIEVKRYCVGNQGDESVGIQPQFYYIEGPFFFEDEKERKEFEVGLQNTFSIICDPVLLFECDQDGYRL